MPTQPVNVVITVTVEIVTTYLPYSSGENSLVITGIAASPTSAGTTVAGAYLTRSSNNAFIKLGWDIVCLSCLYWPTVVLTQLPDLREQLSWRAKQYLELIKVAVASGPDFSSFSCPDLVIY